MKALTKKELLGSKDGLVVGSEVGNDIDGLAVGSDVEGVMVGFKVAHKI